MATTIAGLDGGHLVLGQFRQGYRHLAPFAIAQEFNLDRDIDLGHPDQRRQITRGWHVDAIERQDDVARTQSRLLGRAIGQHPRDQGANRMRQPEGLGKVTGHVLHQDAEPAATDPPFVLELLDDIDGHSDRDRERQPHETARAAVDLRVDANHRPLRSNNGPPELPGLIATSVWMKGT